MTMKEKFYPYCDNEYSDKWVSAEYCEEVADDFAIGFAMSISTHCYCELGNDTRSYKELLETYKKEKGL